ncbi:MAG: amidophosphoribosyltransferase [Candidatus Egerieousia sp.]|nr:amidophosphoribosyltransferase [bacterium]MDY5255297.1 amidophosphoribosyltransferase [Candidatus Egerieousia sp.]
MEILKHECGIAMIRLLKPLEYYKRKYGTSYYALDKLYLMMEKQHNRGQEGAGIACVKLNQEPGHEYMYREKSEGKEAITNIFAAARHHLEFPDKDDPDANPPFNGELYMGHLRYSTTGKGGLKYVHPFLRRNNWKAKNLCLCGNFNMTNVEEVFKLLTDQGQSPRIYSDTYIMLEYLGHRLDREVERNFRNAKAKGLEGIEITEYIDNNVDMANVLESTMPHFDGGYVVCGITGSGEFFTMRDPNGIRPAFYYCNDEIVAVASERPVLQTVFDKKCEDIAELKPGQALLVTKSGEVKFRQIIEQQQYRACSFERIYFSRGNDRDIYRERKELGAQLAESVRRAVDGELERTVVSYIPNTAEIAYYGLVESLRKISPLLRAEKIVSKDIKLRTFITESASRRDLSAHVYDITSGVVEPHRDNLVVIDDSIVRGTTLRESIIRILARLEPKKIVIVSSAPQIRYPDFYGIDMSNLTDFIAFQACVALIEERGMGSLMESIFQEALQSSLDDNPVRRLYEPFTADEISAKMAQLLRPSGVDIPMEFIFQSMEGLHKAIPNHPGDWYFSGHYPTPGGNRMIKRVFVKFYQEYMQRGKE